MTIYHNHHFVPRHAGGSEDPSNIMRVSVAEHAALHYERWVVTGDELDRVAWKFLAGQIRMSEAKKLAKLEGCRRGGKITFSKSDIQRELSRRGNLKKSALHAQGAYKELYETQSIYFKARYTKAKGYVNDGWFDPERGKLQAEQNNSQAACPHCGKLGQYRAMKRWHFDNCKDSMSRC